MLTLRSAAVGLRLLRGSASSSHGLLGRHQHSTSGCNHSTDGRGPGESVRVRYAPSPTGFLHLGGLRTALYNALLARHHKQQGRDASFILRIEDTDRTRLVEGAAVAFENELQWVGIPPDESPLNPGSYGPYVQSERRDIYDMYIRQLFEAGHAYRCFCSAQTLDNIRAKQKGARAFYDRRCQMLTDTQIAANLSAGMPYTYRLRIPQGRDGRTGEALSTTVTDELRGDISFQNSFIDDQVLVKSDGMPTYHFASVVDDHLMRISHVIRGEEWIMSSPKHLLLYQAFGWTPPKFVHLPLLLNAADRSKLSKRQADIDIRSYRAQGFLPEALLNFVAFLGWTPPNVHADTDHFMTLDQLAERFDLASLHRAPAVVDHVKLQWFNGHHLRASIEKEPAVVAAQLGELVRGSHPHSPIASDPEKLDALLKIAISDGRVSQLKDVLPLFDYLFVEQSPLPTAAELGARLDPPLTAEDVQYCSAKLLAGWQEGTELLAMAKQLSKDKEYPLPRKQIFLLIRQLLSGSIEGPPLTDVISLLPPAEIQRRLSWFANVQTV